MSFSNVGNNNLLLEKLSRSEKTSEHWYMNKNTEYLKFCFIIYNINRINCLSFANESLQDFDWMGKQRSWKDLWSSCG